MPANTSRILIDIQASNAAKIFGSGVFARTTEQVPGNLTINPFFPLLGLYRAAPTQISVSHLGLSSTAQTIISDYVHGRPKTHFANLVTTISSTTGKRITNRGFLQADDMHTAIRELTARLEAGGFAVRQTRQTREFLSDTPAFV